MGFVPAIRPAIEIDVVFATAATFSISHTPKRTEWLPRQIAATLILPLTCCYLVELRGFEPLTPSMRTERTAGQEP
jgi:hypothetical protein